MPRSSKLLEGFGYQGGDVSISLEGQSMEDWRRLAGLPPDRAEVPNFGGPGLEEILERHAQEHAQLKREIAERIHAATVPMPPQRKGRRPDDWMKEAVWLYSRREVLEGTEHIKWEMETDYVRERYRELARAVLAAADREPVPIEPPRREP